MLMKQSEVEEVLNGNDEKYKAVAIGGSSESSSTAGSKS